jgi:hypothetical protein
LKLLDIKRSFPERQIADKFLLHQEKTSFPEKIPKLDVTGSIPVARSKIFLAISPEVCRGTPTILKDWEFGF